MRAIKDSVCIICGSPLSTVIEEVYDNRMGADGVFSIAACTGCGVEQTLPVLSPDDLRRLYESHYNYGGENKTPYTSLRARFLGSLVYRIWLVLDGDISFHGRRGRGRLLDVGCNEGRSLMFYQRNGFCVEGLEVNREAAAVARLQGFTVHDGPLDDSFVPDQYDVAVLSNVLEHATDPERMLARISRILKPGGEVWISCPNSSSWLRKVFPKSWINWHVPFHVIHLSRQTLADLLTRQGFAVTGIKNETPALWAAQSVIAALFARQGQKTQLLRNPVLIGTLMAVFRGLLFPFLWAGNRLGRGDCLVVTARKD